MQWPKKERLLLSTNFTAKCELVFGHCYCYCCYYYYEFIFCWRWNSYGAKKFSASARTPNFGNQIIWVSVTLSHIWKNNLGNSLHKHWWTFMIISRFLMSNCAKFCGYVQTSQLNKIPKFPKEKDIFKTVKESLDFTYNLTNFTNCFFLLGRLALIWIEVFKIQKILRTV